MSEPQERDEARGGGPPISPEAFLKWLPWAMAGLLAIVGAVVTMSAGLPWETKEHAADARALIQHDIQSLVTSQAATNKQLDSLASSVAQLTNTMVQWQAAREQEKEDRLKKMLDEQSSETRRYKIELKRQGDHQAAELRVDDETIRRQAAAASQQGVPWVPN